MTEQEKFNAEVQIRLAKQDAKFELFMQELKEQREDMRRLQERQDMAQARHDADIRDLNARIDSKFDSLSNQIHSLTVTAVVGFGALALAVGGLVISLLK